MHLQIGLQIRNKNSKYYYKKREKSSSNLMKHLNRRGIIAEYLLISKQNFLLYQRSLHCNNESCDPILELRLFIYDVV